MEKAVGVLKNRKQMVISGGTYLFDGQGTLRSVLKLLG